METETMERNEEPGILSQFDFFSFAQGNFQNEEMCRFSRTPLLAPLLHNNNKEDCLASCAISIAILRFMRDMPEPYFSEEDISSSEELKKTNIKKYSSGSTFKSKVVAEKASISFLRPNDVPPLTMLNRPTTNIEKIQFISSFGIRRTQRLRDEIYCQICRQLTSNPSKISCSSGWILMALCLGVFTPSNELFNYLKNFLKQGPSGFGEYCCRILQRTLEVNCRRQPPTTVELEAVKNRLSPAVPVTFMDGSTKLFQVDPATTCAELCQLIKLSLGIKSIFGFSIYVASLEQVANWGCGTESIFDAVSLAEQYAQTKIKEDGPDTWKIYFRKDLFEPVVLSSGDKVATDLIYHQIIGGIRAGEYVCPQEKELINLIAKRYYIENGPEMEDGELRKVIKSTLHSPVDRATEDDMYSKVMAAFVVNARIQDRADNHYIKEDVVLYAGTTWFKEFSRNFDATVSAGPKLPKVAVGLAINSRGITVYHKENAKALPLLGLDFSQMKKVKSERKGMYLDPVLMITTNRSTYSFRSSNADAICDLLNDLMTRDSNGNLDPVHT
ncbi:myosin-VIIa-like isoform X1 [Acropora palmata]|uniref:myosin-VIIa-like isoform X1 n=2 Tax=Acropora palmata TaxID=6131 RepID=UPI003DA0F448